MVKLEDHMQLRAAARTMGRRAFAWLLAHEAELRAAGHGDDRKRLKYMGELALIAGTLVDEMPEAGAMLDRAWRELEQGAVIATALPTWPIAATSYLPFMLAGIRSPALDEQLRRLVFGGYYQPFARYAIATVLERVGGTSPWDERETVLANRFFDRPTETTHAIHAELLAHAIMWKTEMGERELDDITLRAYCQTTREWHAVLTHRKLLDPLGEMIVADLCAGLTSPSASIELLCSSQREDGAMPAHPGDRCDELAELYHPTCVAALAGTLFGTVFEASSKTNYTHEEYNHG